MQQFTLMTIEEKQEYVISLRNYASESIPQLKAEFSTELFKKGLELLTAYPKTTSFIEERALFRDYRNQLPSLLRWVEALIHESENILRLQSAQKPDLLTPHRGRPTLEEQKARAEAEAKQAEKMAKIAPTLPIEEKKDDLPAESILDIIALSGSLPTLRQIAWLMPSGIVARIDNLRALRDAFADCSEQAKRYGETGDENRAANAAEEAQRHLLSIKGLYADVDRELAMIHIRLKEDDNYRKQREESWKKIDEVIAFTKPYFKKLTDDDPSFLAHARSVIQTSSPEAIAERERQAEIKKEADSIIKYIMRRDKPNTQKRIATMQDRVKRLRELIGDEAEPYEQKVKVDSEHPVFKK